MVVRPVIVALVVILSGAPALATGPAPSGNASQVVTDAKGDVVDSDSNPLADQRGDITTAAAAYNADSIGLGVLLGRFTDPATDPNWNSDSTYAVWTLDTTGDSKPDFTVEIGVAAGKLYGAVFPAGEADDAPSICAAQSVQVDRTGAYAVHVDPACIGRPASFAWNVEMSYDTDAGNANAPATDDFAPDEEFSAPVFAPPSAAAPGGRTPSTSSGSKSTTSVSQSAVNGPSPVVSVVTAPPAADSVPTTGQTGARGNGILSKQAARESAAGIVRDPDTMSGAAAPGPVAVDDRAAAATAAAARAAAGQPEAGADRAIPIVLASILVVGIAGGILLAKARRRAAPAS